MSLLEFDIIQQYFSKITSNKNTENISLAIGDDAAIVSIPNGKELVVCTDTLNENIHFPHNTSAYDIGYKALAVNLSDLAAMGATPKWFTLNLSLPDVNEQWIHAFAKGLADLAAKYELDLIGGDTTRGALSISITLAGHIQKNQALTRSAAKIGDKVYITGCTGEAAYGLESILKNLEHDSKEYFLSRLNQPSPRVELGKALLGIANACIDVSDGLLADAKHIVQASQCGMALHIEDIPLPKLDNIEKAKEYALSGGDDYELIFTVAQKSQKALDELIDTFKDECTITCIGSVIEEEGLSLLENNQKINLPALGYQHFQ